LLLVTSAFAQTASKGPRTSDVSSVESIVAALYDVISGPPGERDWERFNSLFTADARLITLHKLPNGNFEPIVMTTADYRKRAGEHFLKEGFHERALANKTDRFAHIAHVFSTYETKDGSNQKVLGRGINSIQLLNDGARWWVVTILWDQESPANPIPKQYLK
jgi:hypothetical protein